MGKSDLVKTPMVLVLLVTALTTGFAQAPAAKDDAQTKPPQKRVVKSRSPKATADSELKLKDVHKEHAESDERMGLSGAAQGERNCADLHASAAEMILKNPAMADKVSTTAANSCDELIEQGVDTDSRYSKAKLKVQCNRLAALGESYSHNEVTSCKEVGVELREYKKASDTSAK